MSADHIPASAFRRFLARSVAVPLALLAVLALVFLGQVVFLLGETQWVDHTDQVIGRANTLLKLLVDGETGVRGYLLTGDRVFLEPYQTEEDRSGQAFDELVNLVSDNPPQVDRLLALRDDHADWRGYARHVVDHYPAGLPAQDLSREREGKRRMDDLRRKLAAFIGVEERLRDDRTRATRAATWGVAGTSLVLALLTGGALALLTRRQLVRVSASYEDALTRAEERAATLRKSARRLETVHDIDRAILAAESLPGLVRSALDRVNQIVPSADAFVVVSSGGPVVVLRRSDPDSRLRTEDLAGTGLPPDGSSAPAGLGPAAAGESGSLRERLLRMGYPSCLTVVLRDGGRQFGTLVIVDPRPKAFADDDAQVAAEIARQLAIAFQQTLLRDQLRQHAEELERRVEERTRELQETLGSVKQLEGMLPICAWCKKVRDDRNYWHQVEHYVAAHTDARFTHGMCPDCEHAQIAALRR